MSNVDFVASVFGLYWYVCLCIKHSSIIMNMLCIFWVLVNITVFCGLLFSDNNVPMQCHQVP